MNCIDVIMLAAGKGTRMKHPIPKQFHLLDGIPVIVRTLRVYDAVPFIGHKYVTCAPDFTNTAAEILDEYGIRDYQTVPGGPTRHESVALALQHVSTDRVFVQNANMPFITPALLQRLAACSADCVTPVQPSPYTIFRGDKDAGKEIPQSELFIVKSPQLIRTAVGRTCYERARHDGYVGTNDVCTIQKYGHTVRFVEDDEYNIKITTPVDMALAATLLKVLRRESSDRGADVSAEARSSPVGQQLDAGTDR